MARMSETKDRLRKVMVEALDLGIDPQTIPDKDLVATLGLDSINTIEYLIWVEGEFNIEIADEDLSIDLIDDLDKLASYVEDRQPAPIQVR
jgi:acyl carrier protein